MLKHVFHFAADFMARKTTFFLFQTLYIVADRYIFSNWASISLLSSSCNCWCWWVGWSLICTGRCVLFLDIIPRSPFLKCGFESEDSVKCTYEINFLLLQIFRHIIGISKHRFEKLDTEYYIKLFNLRVASTSFRTYVANGEGVKIPTRHNSTSLDFWMR